MHNLTKPYSHERLLEMLEYSVRRLYAAQPFTATEDMWAGGVHDITMMLRHMEQSGCEYITRFDIIAAKEAKKNEKGTTKSKKP